LAKNSLERLRLEIDSAERFVLVDFLVFRQSHWPACRKLVEAFERRPDCRVRIVAMPVMREEQDGFGEATKKRIIEDGFEPLSFDDYLANAIRPDVIVDNMADDGQRMPGLRFLDIKQRCKHIVQYEHAILTGYTERMKDSRVRVGRTECWQYMVPSAPYSIALPLVFDIGGGIIDLGCPEIDLVIENELANDAEPTEILWNLDAPILGKPNKSDLARIDFMVDCLEGIARERLDQGHIVRPHPVCYNSTEGLARLNRVKKIAAKLPNVKLDESEDIFESYKRSRGFITWMTSTTTMTFLATGRPLAVLPSYVDGGFDTIMDMVLLDALYVVDSMRKIREFCFEACFGADEKREKRSRAAELYLGRLDGHASEAIAEEIECRYLKDVLP